MPEERDLRVRVKVRDSGLRRLKTATGALVVATTALAGVFAGIAAGTTPGRKLVRVEPRAAAVGARPRVSREQSAPVPPPPSLPPLGSHAVPAPAPAPPPTATPEPPVVVSGGS